MSAIETEYFLLFPRYESLGFLLEPDEWTSSRPLLSRALPPGRPLRFLNGYADDLPDPALEVPLDLLFDSVTFAVTDRIRAALEGFEIAGLQFFPAVIVDSLGVEHRDYWYMNVHEQRPWLDRARARMLMPDGVPPGPDDLAYVTRYALDEPAMRAVPEEARLVFMLDGVMTAAFFVHARIVGILDSLGATGFRAFSVASFNHGDQY
jgi:hypothetical protein